MRLKTVVHNPNMQQECSYSFWFVTQNHFSLVRNHRLAPEMFVTNQTKVNNPKAITTYRNPGESLKSHV
jgi:hypothetical protein